MVVKKKTSTVKTKNVVIKLTPEQQELLEKKTKGIFKSATFTFSTKPIVAPKHKIACVLDRVAMVAPKKDKK
jgi:hypothetical protein